MDPTQNPDPNAGAPAPQQDNGMPGADSGAGMPQQPPAEGDAAVPAPQAPEAPAPEAPVQDAQDGMPSLGADESTAPAGDAGVDAAAPEQPQDATGQDENQPGAPGTQQ